MDNKSGTEGQIQPTQRSTFLQFLQQKNQKNQKKQQVFVIDSDQEEIEHKQPQPMDEEINQILEEMQKEDNEKLKISKSRQITINSEIIIEDSKKKQARKRRSKRTWQFLGQARQTRLRKKATPGYFDQVEQINPEHFTETFKDFSRNKKPLPVELRKLKQKKL